MPNILIVDDDVKFAEILAKGLTGDGHKVDCSATCQAALSACASRRPDAVILDIHLTNELGVDFARKIIACPEEYGSPHIIAMSGMLSDETREALEKRQENHFAAFLIKPFPFNELSSLLHRLLPG